MTNDKTDLLIHLRCEPAHTSYGARLRGAGATPVRRGGPTRIFAPQLAGLEDQTEDPPGDCWSGQASPASWGRLRAAPGGTGKRASRLLLMGVAVLAVMRPWTVIRHDAARSPRPAQRARSRHFVLRVRRVIVAGTVNLISGLFR